METKINPMKRGNAVTAEMKDRSLAFDQSWKAQRIIEEMKTGVSQFAFYKKDSSMSRVGIPDYVLFFRNEVENETPITHQDTDPNEPNYLPVDLWQKYASPVWMDVDYRRTLQYRSGRDGNDEKHICPLQLDTIERIIHLYSNEGETVFSPFGGIGSEGFQAIKMGRKSISIELKESYFKLNESNHRAAVEEKTSVLELF